MSKQQTKTTKAQKERAATIVGLLKERYPSAECALQYEGEPWRLLVMGRLSAQCTKAGYIFCSKRHQNREEEKKAKKMKKSVDKRGEK